MKEGSRDKGVRPPAGVSNMALYPGQGLHRSATLLGLGMTATFEASPTKGMLVGHRPAFTRTSPIRVALGARIFSLGGPGLCAC
jgi:hypothetical protein